MVRGPEAGPLKRAISRNMLLVLVELRRRHHHAHGPLGLGLDDDQRCHAVLGHGVSRIGERCRRLDGGRLGPRHVRGARFAAVARRGGDQVRIGEDRPDEPLATAGTRKAGHQDAVDSVTPLSKATVATLMAPRRDRVRPRM